MSASARPHALCLLSLNVNGLADRAKRRHLFGALIHGPSHIVVVETHERWAADGAAKGEQWPGPCFSCRRTAADPTAPTATPNATTAPTASTATAPTAAAPTAAAPTATSAPPAAAPPLLPGPPAGRRPRGRCGVAIFIKDSAHCEDVALFPFEDPEGLSQARQK